MRSSLSPAIASASVPTTRLGERIGVLPAAAFLNRGVELRGAWRIGPSVSPLGLADGTAPEYRAARGHGREEIGDEVQARLVAGGGRGGTRLADGLGG